VLFRQSTNSVKDAASSHLPIGLARDKILTAVAAFH